MAFADSIKILVTNQKGGVGKSTIAANLAAYLAMQEGASVSLIDFDKQASSSRWAKKAPNVGVSVSQVDVNYQTSGLALLSARAGVRKYSQDVDISICDLTWTPAMSEDFMLDFDIVIVPSSGAKFEMASTEIFILEYVQKKMSRLAATKQALLVVPSRVSANFSSAGSFTNLDFLLNCHITPPILSVPEVDSYVYEDFFCVCSDKAIADNFCAFGKYVYQKVEERKNIRGTLSISGTTVNREVAKKVSVLDDYRNRARVLGFYGGSAMVSADASNESQPKSPAPAVARSVGARFIPNFLRKLED